MPKSGGAETATDAETTVIVEAYGNRDTAWRRART
jgi:hypothetical protein